MTPPRKSLELLAGARDAALAAYEGAHRAVLDEVLRLAELEGANVTTLAERAGIARATVYNELARRQEHRDTLEERAPVPPAPADEDAPAPRARPSVASSRQR